MAPAIEKGDVLVVDRNIRHYDGDGTYCFDKGENNEYDIAELTFLPSGGFSYVSDREHPQHIADTSTLNFLGKVVRVLQRSEAPWPKKL